MLLLAKFTVVIPLAAPALLIAWRLAHHADGRLDSRRLAALAGWFAAPSLLFALPVYAWFAARTGWDSFALQALGGFHQYNIRHGLLYHKYWETMCMKETHGFRGAAAALLAWGVPGLALCAAATALVAKWWRTEYPPGPFLLFALLNLTQMNSTVHVPYVFPAVLVAALWGTMVLERKGSHWLQPLRCLALAAILLIPLVRLPLLLRRQVRIQTPAASLRFPEVPGRALARTVALVQSESPPGESVGIFTGHDFLYQILDRPNRLGYYYTLYEPFWRPWAEERFLQRFRAAHYRVLVTHEEESFSHAYTVNTPQSKERILPQLFADFEIISGEDCLPYQVWRRRDGAR
jgi:hypothetical protein